MRAATRAAPTKSYPSYRTTGSKEKHFLEQVRPQAWQPIQLPGFSSSTYTNSHQTGFKNITGSSLPGNRYSAGKKIANTNTPSYGNCSNIYCHSQGTSATTFNANYSIASVAVVTWNAASLACNGCHSGGYAGVVSKPANHFPTTAACETCHRASDPDWHRAILYLSTLVLESTATTPTRL